MPFQRRSNAVADGLTALIGIYRALLPWAAPAAVMAYLLALGGMAWRRLGIEPMAVVASVAGVVVLTRITMLAYVQVVAFPTALHSHYMSPAYPFLLLFCVASFLAAANVARRPRGEADSIASRDAPGLAHSNAASRQP